MIMEKVYILLVFKYIKIGMKKKENKFNELYDFCMSKVLKLKKSMIFKTYLDKDQIINMCKKMYMKSFKNIRNDCVPNSLAYHFVLFLFDYKSRLFIGIKRFPFFSHAWVEELDGEILNSYDYLCRNLYIVLERTS